MVQTHREKSSPEEPAPALGSRAEIKQVEERVAISAHIVHETIKREGEDEFKRTSSALAWSGLAAGLSMGFSLVAEGLLAGHLPLTAWAPLISKLGYSVGFLIVVLARQQLFTESTLTAVLPLLARRSLGTALSVARLWGVVLLANLFGTFVFAFCIARTGVFSPQTKQMLAVVSAPAADSSFWVVLVRAIFAGWLIALMVWMFPAAESAKVSIIIIVTYLIGLGGFNHVIAGSTKMFFEIAAGNVTRSYYLSEFLFPTLIGNMLGGISLVAFLGARPSGGGKRDYKNMYCSPLI
jgi:formate/nitrite transporter FocA (FNT family)